MTPPSLVLPTLAAKMQEQQQRNHKEYTATMCSTLRMFPLAPKEDCVPNKARETTVTVKLDMCPIQATMINAFRDLISMNFSTGGFIRK